MVLLTRKIILMSEEELERFIRRQEKEIWKDNFPEYEKENTNE